jgi:hypothetical protein
MQWTLYAVAGPAGSADLDVGVVALVGVDLV